MTDIEDKDIVEQNDKEQKENPLTQTENQTPAEKIEKVDTKMDDIEDVIEESIDTKITTKEEQWQQISEDASKLIGKESLSLLEKKFNEMTPEQAQHVVNLYDKFNGELDSVIDGLSEDQTKTIEDLSKKFPQLLTPSVFGFSSPEELEAVKNIDDPQVQKILAGIKNISNLNLAQYRPIEEISEKEKTTDTSEDDNKLPTTQENPPEIKITPDQSPIEPTEITQPKEETEPTPKPTDSTEQTEKNQKRPEENANEKTPSSPIEQPIKPDREYSPEMQEQIKHYLKTGEAIPPEIMETFPEATQKALKGLKLSTATGTETLKESYLTKVKAAIEAEAFLITTLLLGGAAGPEAGAGASTFNQVVAGLAHVAESFGLPMASQAIKEKLHIPDLIGMGTEAAIDYATNFEQPDPINKSKK